jgi:TatD DNase family protein
VDLFDTHAHLQFDAFASDLDAVLARARAAGVSRILTVGTDVAGSRAAVALADREPGLWAAVGIHPHDSAGVGAETLEDLARLLAAPRVVAVGEIGLDFYRNRAPRDAQERVFRALIALARRAGKPLVVHCRDAHAEVLRVLAEERAQEVGGIMHCFSGDVDTARRCLELGFMISLAGPLTYPNARSLPAVARWVPADRLVVETDCPFLPPQGHRGQRNEPAHLAITVARLAELRGEPVEAVAERTTRNACTLLGVS